MKNFRAVLSVFSVFLFFSCGEPDEVTESPEYESTFAFSLKNESSESVSVRLYLVERQNSEGISDEKDEWSIAYTFSELSKKLEIGGGKAETVSFSDIIMDHAFVHEWSFILYVGDDIYLGFPKDNPRYRIDLDTSKIKKDSLHSVRLTGGETEPVLNGTLVPKSKTGVEAGKTYRQVSETFSVTLGDEAEISLERVEF